MLIDNDPAQAWEALADFGHVDTRLATGFVTSCTEDEPGVRTLEFFNGAVAREALVGLDATARRLAYTVTDGPLGATHHNASAQVVDHDGRTRFVWVTDVLPDELADTVGQLMDRGIGAIKATLER
jgi:hypothetical protein